MASDTDPVPNIRIRIRQKRSGSATLVKTIPVKNILYFCIYNILLAVALKKETYFLAVDMDTNYSYFICGQKILAIPRKKG
jgi:hypothetical protein